MLSKTAEQYKCTNQTKYNIENEHTIKQIKHWLYSSNENYHYKIKLPLRDSARFQFIKNKPISREEAEANRLTRRELDSW